MKAAANRALRAVFIALLLLEAPARFAFALIVVLVAPVRLGRWALRVGRATADELVCPAGHVNRVDGRWECRCGYVYVGHAFEPCRNCGQVAGWFPCERCGLGVRSGSG